MATYDGLMDLSLDVFISSPEAITQLDNKLALEEQRLEEGLEELIVAINGLSVDNKYNNVKDAVDSLVKTSALEDCACFQPEPHDVLVFLQTLLSIIERSAADANCLLDLLHLSSQHGFVLPHRAPLHNSIASSSLSINTITSSSELEIDQLWHTIRMKLKKQTLKKLSSPSAEDSKLMLLQGLSFLYPSDEAWQIYKSHRGQEINSVLSEGISLQDTKPEEVLKFVTEKFPQVSPKLHSMMAEDCKILVLKVFPELNVCTELRDLYSSKISHFLVVNLNQPPKFNPDIENMSSCKTETLDEVDVMAISTLVSELLELQLVMEEFLQQLEWNGEEKSKRVSKSQPKGVLKVSREVRMSRLGLGTDVAIQNFLPGTIPPPFGATSDMIGGSSSKASQEVKTKTEKVDHWWTKVLCGFEDQLEALLPSLVHQSLPPHDTVVLSIPVTGTRVCGELYSWSSCPRYVVKHYCPFVMLLRQLLPLAVASSVLQEAFMMSIRPAMNDILLNLYKVKDSEGSAIAMNCLQALNITTFTASLLNHLQHALFEGKDSDSGLAVLTQQFLDVADDLSEMLVSYHTLVLSSILCHDGESNNYTDQRDFYEDERCSFSIQMYHLHLESVKHDWSIWLPGKLMQAMLKRVVEKSLSKLAHRYSLVKPSYKRIKQMRGDITTLLVIVHNLMFSFCDSVCDLLGQASFHSSCQCLLRVVAVVSSPLDILCKAFHMGVEQDNPVLSQIPSWLHNMLPGVFPGDATGFSTLPDKPAVHIVVAMLQHQPLISLSLTIQALTMRDALLAQLLCQQTDELVEQPVCKSLGCPGVKNLCCMRQAEKHLLMPIARVLASCYEQPECLANVLVPIIEQTGGCESLPGKREQVPCWLSCIKTLFESHIKRVITRCVNDLVAIKSESKSSLALITRLPCGCPTRKQQKQKWKNDDHILNSAAQTLLSRLSQVVLSLSPPMCLVFQRLQLQLDKKTSSKNAVALQVLCWCVWSMLRDEQFDIGDKSAAVTLKRASEMTMEVLSMQDDDDYHSHPLNSECLKEVITMTTTHCKQDHLSSWNINPLEQAPLVFQEKYYKSLASSMAMHRQETQDLIFINKIIQNNAVWIQDQLGIPGMLHHPKTTDFQCCCTPELATPKVFNPIEHFNKLGDSAFDHSALYQYPWNWPELLKANLDLTLITFKHLFCNRFEMLEGEPLNEEEKKYIDILKDKYELD